MTPLRWFEIGMSVIAGFLSIIVFSFLILFPIRPVFFALTAAWVAILALFLRRVSRHQTEKIPIVSLGIATTVSCISLIGITEWRPLQTLLILFSGVMTGLLVALGIGDRDAVLEYKRMRRLLTMFWVFNAFALSTALSAVGLFFPKIPSTLLFGLGGIAYAGCAWMIWRLYVVVTVRDHGVWIALFALLMAELLFAIHLLPFGYVVSGVLAAWLWYIAQLFARFHFGPQGIVWKRQQWFLLWNAAFYAATLLFFVRWV